VPERINIVELRKYMKSRWKDISVRYFPSILVKVIEMAVCVANEVEARLYLGSGIILSVEEMKF